MGKNRFTMGLLIIVIGILLILFKMDTFDFLFDFSWPFIFLLISIIFHVLFFMRIFPSGILIPSGILGTYGLLFIFLHFTQWGHLQYLWPVFILGVAIGLFEFYALDRNHEKGVLTAATVLTIIACVFFSFTLLYTVGIYFIAVVLILFGLWMILGRK
ncbi:hypothetical protein [Chengkuizengella axinellae]|uniref:DUF5668 domain-containing protein n=1 Tax=Chengkuizengella axinellae TaxID=3064388 RepID=A0ABT9IUV2_9BACL|nr:hypothetical protein [Chengkuizengella sp. 2205SS18-9]MDP5273126.1 hypothetical protein [Chengkuizengella sp. 2205SS18-9]